jgi:hypothetical protein
MRVRANLIYRAFCRIEGERVPDAKTLIRLAQVLDGPARKRLLERLVTMAGEPSGARAGGCASIRRGWRHYPLSDGQHAPGGWGARPDADAEPAARPNAMNGVVRLRDRTRSVARRVFAITPLSRHAKRKPDK